MGAPTSPRGRLPQRVYWFRRGVVVLVALLLVLGIGKLLTGGSNASDGQGEGGHLRRAALDLADRVDAGAPRRADEGHRQRLALVERDPVGLGVGRAAGRPSGPCTPDEVSVVPAITQAWAGTRTTIQLQLQGTQPACTFEVSSDSVVVKVTSGADRIWSTQDCPKAVPSREVVVRSGVTTAVPVNWNGRRSDPECTGSGDFALPGYYHVLAAALGSAPSDQQFQITRAPTRRITQTPSPTAQPTPRKQATSSPSPRG